MTLQSESHWAGRMEVVVPRRRGGIVHQVMDAEALLYDQLSGCTHRMNKTALSVWRACDGRSTTREVAQGLAETYEVSLERALEDVEQLIAAFARADLVTAADNR